MHERTKKELETIIFNAIIGWYDNSLTDYKGIDDEGFIRKVCETTGLTTDEYKKIMLLTK